MLERDAFRVCPELYHIAVAAETQTMADDLHLPRDEPIAPPLCLGGIVAAAVFQPPLCGAEVFGPLLFQMDERSLTAAEAKMLDAGHLQVIIGGVHQDILSQVMPSGRSSETETV